jgi:hypothetical protein
VCVCVCVCERERERERDVTSKVDFFQKFLEKQLNICNEKETVLHLFDSDIFLQNCVSQNFLT